MKNGKKVTSAKQWPKRRAEIGGELGSPQKSTAALPLRTPAVRWEVTNTAEEVVAGVQVTTRTLVGHVDNSSCPLVTVDLQLTLTTPAQVRRARCPVILNFGFGPAAARPARRRVRRGADRRGRNS